ncbi:hotdog domain-containing protein [Mycolicibacterium sp. 120266]|uniref:PaaI family thioesterase n=1 Tax=Mycolicibacterium sp. 120266 TaxID=3090601 RepID=UPI00299EFAFA|nr:hotdog domain-containing protein [Mycolicibacterium sp. 120266]MDX1875105.1 hotdog domain-containing protein [Mycolicibacterium sp. 120266]
MASRSWPSSDRVGNERACRIVEDPRSVEARFGLRHCGPTEAGGYRCRFGAPEWLRDDDGRPLRGALAVLVDHVLGELPYRRREPDKWPLTAELAFDIVGELPVGAEMLVAEAVAVPTAVDPFLQCRIRAEDGTVLVVGSARMVYVGATAREASETLVVPDVPVDETSVDGMLGLSRSPTEEGCQISVTKAGRWVNDFGILHGGVSAAVSEFAAAEAVRAHNPALATAHMQISFLRPVAADDRFVASARVLHIGRSSAVIEVLGRGGHDELCTVSVVTARL